MKKMYMKDLKKDLHLRLSVDDLELASRIASRRSGWTLQDAIRYAICVAAIDLDIFDAFISEKSASEMKRNEGVYNSETGETFFDYYPF